VLPAWRDLLVTFRRLEDRGEVRGGRFVSGFVGEQFAVPIAVDSVRALRQAGPSGQVIAISAADPLNLTGVVLPGERIPTQGTRLLRFRDGVPIGEDAGPAVADAESKAFSRSV